jgi:hypothetical protein
MDMKCILHENQSSVQEIRNETTAKNVFKGNENGQLYKRQLPEGNRGGRTEGIRENGTVGESDSSERS